MLSKEQPYFGSAVVRLLKRKISMLLIAFMLGMSNVILEEDRMVNDTREHIEQQEVVPDEDLFDSIAYEDVF